MNEKLNLVKRFLSDTPDFWKVVGFVGMIMASIAGYLADNGVVNKWITIMGAVGTTLAVAAPFVKKDIQLLESTTNDFGELSSHLPEFKEQAEAVIKSLKPAADALSGDPDKPIINK